MRHINLHTLAKNYTFDRMHIRMVLAATYLMVHKLVDKYENTIKVVGLNLSTDELSLCRKLFCSPLVQPMGLDEVSS